ncbi:MAG: hypothetical protein M1281_19005 [Chloroflexi bacterium]|nr:hypothetical protein [Chloroflexota bacterium]
MRVLAAAYGANGEPIGLRRWENTGKLAPGNSLSFSTEVYSLGSEIRRVEVTAEASQ